MGLYAKTIATCYSCISALDGLPLDDALKAAKEMLKDPRLGASESRNRLRKDKRILEAAVALRDLK